MVMFFTGLPTTKKQQSYTSRERVRTLDYPARGTKVRAGHRAVHVARVYITGDIIPETATAPPIYGGLWARLPNSSHLFLEVLNRIAVGPARPRRRPGFNFNKYRTRLPTVVTRVGMGPRIPTVAACRASVIKCSWILKLSRNENEKQKTPQNTDKIDKNTNSTRNLNENTGNNIYNKA